MSKAIVTRTQHQDHPVHQPYQLYNLPSIPDDPSAELAKVEAEVDKVTTVLAGLLNRVTYLKAQINVSKSLFLRLLPPEIIAEIFTLCVEVPDDEPGKVDNAVPLTLGAVCNAFRTIAWNSPQLWATVVLDVKSAWKVTAKAALLSDWLLRSGQLPLSIWLNSSEDVLWTFAQPEVILEVINRFSNRWKYVDIRLPSSCYEYLPSSEESLPILESLTLKPPGGQGDRNHLVRIRKAPMLKSIALQCLYLRSIRFEWHLLTSLDLESFYIDESLEIFRHASNLMHLILRRILGGDDSHTLPTVPIVMSTLSSLTFVNDKATDLAMLLDMIILPALRRLSFSGEGTTYAPCLSLTRVIQRSSCPLESLSLKNCSINHSDFEILLSRIPSVKELCLEIHDGMSSSESDMDDVLGILVARANEQYPLLPNLEKFSYTGILAWSWLQMLQMVESRTIGISAGGDPSTPIELLRPDIVDPGSTGRVPVRLREVSLCLTFSTEEEAAALTPIEPPFAQDTGLKWTLETVVKTGKD